MITRIFVKYNKVEIEKGEVLTTKFHSFGSR